MATQTGAKCRLCRRESEKLYLKGEKCFTMKCPIVSRNYIPGQHGPTARRPRLSEFGTQLREKEYVKKAAKNPAETGDALLRLLELRLDNIVYRLGFAQSRRSARQLVGHGHIKVNGKIVTIPSYQVKVNDVISAVQKISDKKEMIKSSEDLMKKRGLPEWLSRTEIEGKIETTPDVSVLKNNYNTSLIVEFYSR